MCLHNIRRRGAGGRAANGVRRRDRLDADAPGVCEHRLRLISHHERRFGSFHDSIGQSRAVQVPHATNRVPGRGGIAAGMIRHHDLCRNVAGSCSTLRDNSCRTQLGQARGARFYDRMRDVERGINRGYFITPEDLEQRRPNFITQMLESYPSVRVLRKFGEHNAEIQGVGGAG
jgi:hypothetical protein